MFKFQGYHFLALGLILLIFWPLTQMEDFGHGSWLGISTWGWFLSAIAIAILHQIYVWLAWRGELYHSWWSNHFGEKGFLYFRIVFFCFLLGRLGTIIPLAISNRGTLEISWVPYLILILICSVPSLYTVYCVKKYFSFTRAAGADHFDKRYRGMGLEMRGVFKYIPNAMYTVGLLVLWIPGILFCSKTALVAAAFHHLYVWVHYFCTERPDMEVIYF